MPSWVGSGSRPSFDAPAGGAHPGRHSATPAVPFDLTAEEDNYAELGISARVIPQLTLSLTPWVRLSTNTIDDEEVGDTALTADYNYNNGRAWGTELAANLVIGKNLRAFGNFSYQVSEGEGIATSRVSLHARSRLSFPGYQATDNAQLFTANVGLDLARQRPDHPPFGLDALRERLAHRPHQQRDPAPDDHRGRRRCATASTSSRSSPRWPSTCRISSTWSTPTASPPAACRGPPMARCAAFNVRLIIPFGS